MKLTACIACHKGIARNAGFCPHCGSRRPTARQRLFDKILMTGMTLILGLLLVRIFPIVTAFFAELP